MSHSGYAQNAFDSLEVLDDLIEMGGVANVKVKDTNCLFVLSGADLGVVDVYSAGAKDLGHAF